MGFNSGFKGLNQRLFRHFYLLLFETQTYVHSAWFTFLVTQNTTHNVLVAFFTK